MDFRLWKTSLPICKALVKLFAPTGTIINSWNEIGESEWLPPLIMFISGTGKTFEFESPKYLKRDIFFSLAAAFETARETERIAFAPSLDLLFVPSSLIIFSSISFWSKIDRLFNSFEIISFTFFTALKTDLPIYESNPSLNSTDSCSPVDAPDGTAALPITLFVVITSVSTVGFPLESKICLDTIFFILVIG